MQKITDINWAGIKTGTKHPSPSNWEDQILYFLLVDRFSDNQEAGFAPGGTTPAFVAGNNGNAVGTPAAAVAWTNAGGG